MTARARSLGLRRSSSQWVAVSQGCSPLIGTGQFVRDTGSRLDTGARYGARALADALGSSAIALGSVASKTSNGG